MSLIKQKYLVSFLIIILYFTVYSNHKSPIPIESKQMVLVLTDSITSSNGTLDYFQRIDTNQEWKFIKGDIQVVLGINGLGWGIGLHKPLKSVEFPMKTEGDGKSPAGVFILSSVFGYTSNKKIKKLKMPYIHINEKTECIDDVNSRYYNRIVVRDKTIKIDWKSSEKMYYYGVYYKLGVIIDHNFNQKKKAGSCIFLHNWSNPNETMPGCTAMAPENMTQLIHWLDIKKKPIIVQLTKKIYLDLKKKWKLPKR